VVSVSADDWREFRRRPPGRGSRRGLVVTLVVLGLLAPITYSWVSMAVKPSSLPLSIRTVEWVRANHGTWLVDNVERLWYTWHAPKKGGPTLQALPTLPAVAVHPRRLAIRRVTVHFHYRPRTIEPALHPRLPGEGIWHPVGWTAAHAPSVLASVVRPDAEYPRTVAYVVWLDHTRTRLFLHPGRYEPPAANPRGPMQVPAAERPRLVATFNSGFTYSDGHGGFAVGGRTFEPFRAGDGTVVEYRNGRVDVRAWGGGATAGRNVVLARQNLPLIVAGGRPNPNLSDGLEWGATLGNAILVWRSGLGIDRRGNLIYAAADYQTVGSLARLLVRAGAVRAIELDINPEWPSFIVYASRYAGDPVKIVPNWQQPATRYLVPDDRDFFAVVAR
jgi:hypothetical protein